MISRNFSQTMEDMIEEVQHNGVTFYDIGPLLKYHFVDVITHLDVAVALSECDYVVGIEARGFALGAALAARRGVGFIPIRKAGKLPPPVIGEKYEKEYGEDAIEISAESLEDKRVVVVDDVLATGGTMKAAVSLLKRAGASVVHVGVIVEIPSLNGRKGLDVPVGSWIRK